MRRNEAGHSSVFTRAASQDGLFQQRHLFLSPNVFTIHPLTLSEACDLNKTFRSEPNPESSGRHNGPRPLIYNGSRTTLSLWPVTCPCEDLFK